MELEKSDIKTISGSGIENSPSKVDVFSGKHTTSLIVATMFVLTLILFVLIYCIKDNVSEIVITGFFSLLSLLAGYYAGTTSNNKTN